ncbi:hypothetical protein BOX15_Mlig014628g1, partial [Macrostomum lignano]
QSIYIYERMSSPDPTSNDLHVNNKDYIDGNKEAEYLALINRGAVLLSRYPLVPQSANHDCGIACLRMVLRGLDVPQAETLLAEAMEASDLGESVWTPDLLRILLHCGLRAQLYSICLLPNPGYAQLNFYRDKFSSDQQRVARNLDWISQIDPQAAVQQSLPLSAVLDHLSARLGPVICLIDANNTDAARLRSCMHCNCLSLSSPCCGGGPYQGHYILLCGYLPEERRLIYRDPMSRISEYKLMSFKEFDRVRTAYGTDEDLLFVFG